MKRQNRKLWVFTWLMAGIMLLAAVPARALAEEGNSLPQISGTVMPEPDESTITVDVSDMVYKAGGWGVPSDGAATYAVSDKERLKADIVSVIEKEVPKTHSSGSQYVGVNVGAYRLAIEDWSEAALIVAEVMNEHPEFFYLKPQWSYSKSEDGKAITWMWFWYRMNSESERKEFEDRMAKALACVDPAMSDVEKALVLHDYLVQYCAYAKAELDADTLDSVPHVHDAYGALVNGKAVCQGYAEAYHAMLARVGIQSVLSPSHEAMNHVWNVVLLNDGKWYHVDATWDDPTWNREGRVRHEYFLLSDAEMLQRNHRDWTDPVECDSTKYDSYWWRTVDSQIVIQGGRKYYIDAYQDGENYKGFQIVERDGDAVTAKYTKEARWRVEQGTYRRAYSYLSQSGGYLYFNDDQNLYAMRTTDAEPRVVYTYKRNAAYENICGAMIQEDGTARLNVYTDIYEKADNFITVDLKAEIPVPAVTIDEAAKRLTTTEQMEYSLDNGATWHGCTANMEMAGFGWDGRHSLTVFFRIRAEGGLPAGNAVTVTLPSRPDLVSGVVKAPEDKLLGQATLRLKDGSGKVVSEIKSKDGSGEYLFQGIAEGTYVLEVEKAGYAVRSYEIAVGKEPVQQDVELWHIGDINGDGKVNTVDKRLLFLHLSGKLLTGYAFQAADVNDDGKINITDKRLVYYHIAGKKRLW